MDSAFEECLKDLHHFIYAIGSVVGPHPLPKMVRDFQSIIGRESREQFLSRHGRLPDHITAFLDDEEGTLMPMHSIASGLDYPGVGPQYSHLKDIGRVDYQSASDDECLDAFLTLSRVEGIIPALESAHAVTRMPTTWLTSSGCRSTSVWKWLWRPSQVLDHPIWVRVEFGPGEARSLDAGSVEA